MDGMDEIIGEFLVESYENLDRLDDELLALERDAEDRETMASIFRSIHTIKGTCGFLGFTTLEGVTHVGESLLSRLRDGELALTPDMMDALLQLVDAVRAILAEIESSGTEGDVDYDALVARLQQLQEPAEPEPQRIGEVLVDAGRVTEEQVDTAVVHQLDGDPRHLGEILVGEGALQPDDVVDALSTQSRQGGVADSTVRIDVALLDRLMNLVGELVLARNQILQLSAEEGNVDLVTPSQRLNLITSELQEGVMKTRMQPIGNVWSRFPRVVRDLSLSCGKEVEVAMEGRDTELDKTIIEAIKDPLTHLVRNAVDHGVEHPDVREAAGKPRAGTLLLRAFHEGGHVNIEISDDGAGIDAERLRAKALERGVITPDEAARMGEREALQLVFAAGFSTAAEVTNVSGRGVGMDVVRTNIERIGGTVDIATEAGVGTTFRVKIPLTLAIIPALVVTTGGERYAIPQLSLVELVRLEGERARTGIEDVHGAPVYRLRGKLLPILDLDKELGAGSEEPREVVNIAVLQADGHQFGLVVDEVNDTQEIVVKPLGTQLKGLTAFAGATIMGDGQVALILDVLGLAQRARVVGEVREQKQESQTRDVEAGGEARQTLLLLEVGHGRRLAIPLAAVSRLEEFPRETIESAGSHQVVQYREQILPLVHLAEAVGVGASTSDSDGPLSVVVHTRHGRSVGLVVERIADIVEEHINVESATGRTGLLGSAVIQQHVTDVVDLDEVVAGFDPAFFTIDTPAAAGLEG
jgi:two-component system, chemotaxis family, sensor kinase CheA